MLWGSAVEHWVTGGCLARCGTVVACEWVDGCRWIVDRGVRRDSWGGYLELWDAKRCVEDLCGRTVGSLVGLMH